MRAKPGKRASGYATALRVKEAHPNGSQTKWENDCFPYRYRGATIPRRSRL